MIFEPLRVSRPAGVFIFYGEPMEEGEEVGIEGEGDEGSRLAGTGAAEREGEGKGEREE